VQPVLSEVIEKELQSIRVHFVYVLTELVVLDNGQTICPYGIDDLMVLTLSGDSEGS